MWSKLCTASISVFFLLSILTLPLAWSDDTDDKVSAKKLAQSGSLRLNSVNKAAEKKKDTKDKKDSKKSKLVAPVMPEMVNSKSKANAPKRLNPSLKAQRRSTVKPATPPAPVGSTGIRGKTGELDKSKSSRKKPDNAPKSIPKFAGKKDSAPIPTGKTDASGKKSGFPQMGGSDEDRKIFSEFAKGQTYHIDYYEQDLIEFVKQMSEKFKVNFILSDKIKGGKITIISPNPVTREEAWQAFLSALESKGLTLVRVGKFYKIIQSRDAVRRPIKTYLNGGSTDPSDEVITYLLKLQHISPKDIDKIIKELKSKDGHHITFEPTNTIMITDAAINIRRIVKIVNELDLPGGRDSIHVIDIYYASADDIADKLQQIFGEKGKKSKSSSSKKRKSKKSSSSSSAGDDDSVTITNIISDERTNQLIVVAPRDAMPKILDMINRLDIQIPGDGQVHVYYLENANAEELASTLTGLAGKGSSRKKKKSKSSSSSSSLFEGEVKITADKATNSLVIVASTKDFNSIKNVIKRLDLRRRQVFVEAVIMEVTLRKDNTQGVSLNGGYSLDIGGDTVPIFGGTTLGALSSIAMDPTTLTGLALGLQGPDLAGTEGLLGSGISIPAFGIVLQMIQTDSDANVLSTPHILTMDNEEAEIIVGSNVPFITGQARDSNNNPVLSIQRQDVALTMKIKPQINESDFVRLQVQQEITELVSISETLGPTTTKRAAKSTVVVKDNQTIVIGGLLRDKETNDAEKIPLLGDIPILGRLFRRDKTSKEKTNLLIFLTPHIIKDESDFQRIFKRKMNERKEFLQRFYGTDESYEFETDYSQKTGTLEAIRSTYEKEMAIKSQREQESKELLIAPDNGHSSHEVGVTPLPDSSGSTSSSSSDSRDKMPSADNLRHQMMKIKQNENDGE